MTAVLEHEHLAMPGDLLMRATAIAESVVAAHADEVDRDARFPHEAIAALRDAGLLGAMVPRDLGGYGATMSELARITEVMGRACSSTGMIFAMHQIQVASLVRHATSPALLDLLREVAERQLLLASATTEIGIGGDVRTSSCAVERDGERFVLAKNAPVISYGRYADAVLVTARRGPDSPPNDQVLVVCRQPALQLEQTSDWDVMGFRGTCSPGFLLHAEGSSDMVFELPYADISARTMLPTAHILWAAVWFGMASAAVEKARRFVRAAARAKPGTTPPGATRLAELMVVHHQFGEVVRGAAQRFDETDPLDPLQDGLGFAIAMNSLKVSASTLVVDIVGKALLVCGIAGYREDSSYRMGRLLRDAYGAALMVNNDRILGNNAQLLLVAKD